MGKENIGGVVARTIVLDRMVKNYIAKHPETTVVNIACGMDTRFYRVDNGKVSWYNIDLPVTMAVREKYIQECMRVYNIASSAMDECWAEQIPAEVDTALIIVEGLSMYLSADDVRQILSIINHRFSHATVFMEILNPVFIKKNVENPFRKAERFSPGEPKTVKSLCILHQSSAGRATEVSLRG